MATRSGAHRQPAERLARSFLQRDPLLEARALTGVQDVLRLERKIRFQAKHNGCALQSANLANPRDVLEYQGVGVLDLSCAQLIDTEQLPHTHETTVGQKLWLSMALRPLLLGPPLQERCDTEHTDTLAPHVASVQELLKHTYGNGPEAAQAVCELDGVAALDADFSGMACQRALLLFSCHREPAVASHFCDAFARDMTQRVLPFVTPRFLANQCQAPDAYVMLSLVLAEMWPGERLGNWPLTQQAGEPRFAQEA